MVESQSGNMVKSQSGNMVKSQIELWWNHRADYGEITERAMVESQTMVEYFSFCLRVTCERVRVETHRTESRLICYRTWTKYCLQAFACT